MSFTPQTEITPRVTRIQGRINDFALPLTVTGIIEGATPVDAGMVVIKGTADNEVILPAAAFTIAEFSGVIGWSPVDKEKALFTGVKQYVAGDTASVGEDVEIEVLVTDTVAKWTAVWFVHTVGNSAVHTFRSDIDTDKASQIPAVYLEAGTTGDIVKIRVSLGAKIASLLP